MNYCHCPICIIILNITSFFVPFVVIIYMHFYENQRFCQREIENTEFFPFFYPSVSVNRFTLWREKDSPSLRTSRENGSAASIIVEWTFKSPIRKTSSSALFRIVSIFPALLISCWFQLRVHLADLIYSFWLVNNTCETWIFFLQRLRFVSIMAMSSNSKNTCRKTMFAPTKSTW